LSIFDAKERRTIGTTICVFLLLDFGHSVYIAVLSGCAVLMLLCYGTFE